jgi:hypothetical protein
MYLVHLNMLEFCNSTCVVPIGKALHVVDIDGGTVKASAVLVQSLCSITEGSADRDSAISLPDI